MDNTYLFFVMGVSGCGKSTIGKLLAETLHYPFFDGDDYHLEANVKKMAAGHPLTDEDRMGWLATLNQLARKHSETGAVITCSALKESYRLLLARQLPERVYFVYLKGSFELIMGRLQERKGHFMPPTLLKSQFEALEPPVSAIQVSIDNRPEEVVSEILAKVRGH
jgi:gluconokinase